MSVRKLICYIVLITVTSFGVSLMLKANVGVGAWDALAQAGSTLTTIPVGTVGMIFNILCVLIELLILKKNFKINHAFQIGMSVILGVMVNFFYYHVLGSVVVNNYVLRIFLLILGNVITSFVVASIMLLEVVTFALEGACKVISDKYGIVFHKLRQWVDIVSIAIVILLSVVFKIELYVREGTIIGMLIFSPMLGYFMKVLKPILLKMKLM